MDTPVGFLQFAFAVTDDVMTNPFGLPKPAKDKVVVLQSAVMRGITRGRRNYLKRGLTHWQVGLLQEDFLQGLDF